MSAEEKRDFREFVESVREAAIQAEYETGDHEASIEEARSHIAVRVVKIIGGFALVALGIVLMPLPGPGWAIVAGGLALLATEFEWANRLLQHVRRSMPGVPEDGKIPLSSWISMAVVMGLAVGAAFLVQRYIDLSDTWAAFLDLF